MKPQRLLAPLLALSTLASCAQTSSAPPAEAESVRLGRELRSLIGPATCSDDSQCRTIAVGAKACGGPAGYAAWSTQGTDAQRVTDLARRQAEAHRREIEASGMASNCAMVVDPGAACVAARCELTTRHGGAR